MKNLIFVLIMALLFSFTAFATTVDDETVTATDRVGKLIYSGATTFTNLTTGDAYYTQAMYIGATNYNYAYGRFICSEVGTEDINVFVEYSFDGTNWVAGTTDADLDALGTTAVVDTIGLVQGVAQQYFSGGVWMRLKFVPGQTITTGCVLSWVIALRKPAGLERATLGKVKDVT